jgi:4-methyl-5(b-hydroxyethyl)-thiazole monophosphate biosynthesis
MADETGKILLFLAQGFEDLEAIAVLDVFGWTQYRENIQKASVTTAGFHPLVKSRFGLEIKADLLLSQVHPDDYRALVLPGGFYGYGFDEAFDEHVYQIARKIHQNGGYIATMCVGILPIAEAGLLIGKKATTYPYSRNHDNIERLKKNGADVVKGPVVMDDRIISCSGPGAALEVAFLLMDSLLGVESSREVRHYMIYRRPSIKIHGRGLKTPSSIR